MRVLGADLQVACAYVARLLVLVLVLEARVVCRDSGFRGAL